MAWAIIFLIRLFKSVANAPEFIDTVMQVFAGMIVAIKQYLLLLHTTIK